jgi:excisionase family DNA binding protein
METMRTDEAAKVLKVSPYQVRELLKSGHVPGAKFGQHWRVDAEALKAKLKGSNSSKSAQDKRAKK